MENPDLRSELLSLKFEGDTSIEADFLISSLSNMLLAYKLSISEMYEGLDFNVNVKAFQPGSFEVVLDTVIDCAPAVLGYAPTVLECAKNFIEIIKIKRDMAGQKPAKVENIDGKTVVTTQNGTINYYNSPVYNIYTRDSQIDSALSRAFSSAESLQRPAVAVSGADCIVRVPEQEYKAMSTNIIDNKDEQKFLTTESDISALLLLKSPDLLGDSKWKFKYKGKQISASITDEEFKNRVKDGKIVVYAGVKVPVILHIEAIMNEDLQVVRRNYTITKVTGNIVEPQDYQGEQIAIEDVYFREDYLHK